MLQDKLDALLQRPDPQEYAPPQVGPPKGWEPAVERSANEVVATLPPREAADVADAELLAQLGLDPEHWQVTSVRRSQWQSVTGETLESTRVSAQRRVIGGVDSEEMAELRRQVSLLPVPPAASAPAGTPKALVVLLSDWQAGKGEGGGSAALVDRLEKALPKLVARAYASSVTEVWLLGLGDLVEGCTGFYPSQEFQTDLNRREQANLVRRMLLKTLASFAQVGLPLHVAAVPGNHGENRKSGKSFTTPGDNDDVAVFEQVADVVSAAPGAFGNATFVLPNNDLTLAVDIAGVRVGLSHGHMAGGGGMPQNKLLRWWEKQALGTRPVGSAQLLVTGHYHHFSAVTHGHRTHIQAPALDGGSAWFTEMTGSSSPAGMLSFMVGSDCGPLGWNDIQIV